MTQRSLIFLLLANLLTSCMNTWSSSEALSYQREDIWDACYQVLVRRYDILKASEEEGVIETDWKFEMTQFYMQSYRYKARVKLEPYQPDKKTGEEKLPEEEKENPTPSEQKYIVKVQVLAELNRDIDDPGAIASAFWVPEGNSPEREAVLLGFIKAVLESKFSSKKIKTEAAPPAPIPIPDETDEE